MKRNPFAKKKPKLDNSAKENLVPQDTTLLLLGRFKREEVAQEEPSNETAVAQSSDDSDVDSISDVRAKANNLTIKGIKTELPALNFYTTKATAIFSKEPVLPKFKQLFKFQTLFPPSLSSIVLQTRTKKPEHKRDFDFYEAALQVYLTTFLDLFKLLRTEGVSFYYVNQLWCVYLYRKDDKLYAWADGGMAELLVTEGIDFQYSDGTRHSDALKGGNISSKQSTGDSLDSEEDDENVDGNTPPKANSRVYLEGVNVNALFDYLLNWTHPIRAIHVMQTPLLISSHCFPNSTCTISSEKTISLLNNGETIYKTVFNGLVYLQDLVTIENLKRIDFDYVYKNSLKTIEFVEGGFRLTYHSIKGRS